LDLLSINSLAELGRANFRVFNKKQSCQQLAKGVIQRAASDMLQLRHIWETHERCHLLHHHFEARRNARVRTPMETQNAIETVYRVSVTLHEVERLSNGLLVQDTEAVVGRIGSLMGKWRGLCSLVTATPHTGTMIGMVKRALHDVITDAEVREGVKIVTRRLTRRALTQWTVPSEPARPEGQQVNFDSD
jgi:hypothetical protein